MRSERLTEWRLEELVRRMVTGPDGEKVYYKAAIRGVSVAEEHCMAVELLELRRSQCKRE